MINCASLSYVVRYLRKMVGDNSRSRMVFCGIAGCYYFSLSVFEFCVLL